MQSLTLKIPDNPKNREAIRAFNRADIASKAGNISKAKALLTEATIDQIIRISQNNPAAIELLNRVGNILIRCKSFSNAEKIYKTILSTKEDMAAYNKLACMMKDTNRFAQARDLIQKACQLFPGHPSLLINLAGIQLQMGLFDENQELYNKIKNADTLNAATYSSYLQQIHYLHPVNRERLFSTHQKCNQFYPQNQAPAVFANNPDPNRKIRLGYISPDFHFHSVTWFLMPILKAHNRDKFELFAYSNVRSPDKISDQYPPLVDHYKSIYNLKTEDVCNLIRKDSIDILIDLAGHTGDNSLPVLAQKPAPVQVTYLGYPDTTGLPQVDYRLTDPQAEAPDAHQYYTEKLFYLEDGFLCYSPPIPCPEIGLLPAQQRGYVTFGSFNMNKKINPFVVQLWADVLKACKDSRLILKFLAAADPVVKANYLQQFKQAGIAEDRIEIYSWLSQQEHMNLYNQIDIALDTYPYHGTTTTCEAFYMGVPVISLIGDHHMSRVGLSLLTRVGMDFFAASSREEYISKAVALAARPDSLAKIRASMRVRMAASSLCNGNKFTHTLEQAYRTMWHRWCQRMEVTEPCTNTINTECESKILLTDTKET